MNDFYSFKTLKNFTMRMYLCSFMRSKIVIATKHVAHTHDLCVSVEEVEGSKVQGKSWSDNEFKTSLSRLRLCLKNTIIINS